MSTNAAWILLIIAGFLETVWAIALKYSDGFSKLVPSVITIIFAGISFFMLSKAMSSTISASVAYGVWVAIGTVGMAIYGVMYMGETMNVYKTISFVLLLAGVIGLKLTS